MPLPHPEDKYIRSFLMRIRLDEIMTRNIISLYDDDPFYLVEEKMRENRIRHLPVVDFERKLVGIMTQRDLYRVQSPRRDEDGNIYYDKESLNSHSIKAVMTKEPMALSPDDFVGTAVLLMVEKKFGCLPIVNEDRKLVGLVTQLDILRVLVATLKTSA